MGDEAINYMIKTIKEFVENKKGVK